MVRRSLALIALAALLAPVSHLTAFASPGRTEGPARASQGAPGRLRQPDMLLEWVIRSADVVACETAAPEIRQLRYEYRDRLRVVVYSVAADTALIRSFLRDELLGGVELRSLNEWAFERQFAHRAGRTHSTPLAVITDAAGRERVFSADARLVTGRRDIQAMSLALASALRPDAVSRSQHAALTMERGDQ